MGNRQWRIQSDIINQNTNIRGIPIANLKEILSQFADDTIAYLRYERLTIENFL